MWDQKLNTARLEIGISFFQGTGACHRDNLRELLSLIA